MGVDLTALQRHRVESLVERLLALLDADAGDPDLEESDTGIASLDALLMAEHPERYPSPREVAA